MKVETMFKKYGKIYVEGSVYNFGWKYRYLIFENLDYFNQWMAEGADEFYYEPISETYFKTKSKGYNLLYAYKHKSGIICFENLKDVI